MERYILAGLVAAAVTLFLTPFVRALALRYGFVDAPNARRVNAAAVPSGGGISIYLGFWSAAFLVGSPDPAWWGLFLGSTLILLLGLVDDRRSLSPAVKFAGQMAAAGLLVGLGTRIDFVTNPLGGMIYLGLWGVPVTILWVVAITNVLNFIDGLDGLAAGIAAIACIPLAVIAMGQGQMMVVFLTVVLLGSTVGFLRYNFNPARIFMGDAGAMFAGFVLAAIAVEGALKGATTVALTVPLLTLGLPLFDGACAIIRRVSHGKPISQADAGHVHHRLLAMGLSQRQAVLLLYGISAVLSLGALALLALDVLQSAALLVVILAASLFGARWLGILELEGLPGSGARVASPAAGGTPAERRLGG